MTDYPTYLDSLSRPKRYAVEAAFKRVVTAFYWNDAWYSSERIYSDMEGRKVDPHRRWIDPRRIWEARRGQEWQADLEAEWTKRMEEGRAMMQKEKRRRRELTKAGDWADAWTETWNKPPRPEPPSSYANYGKL